MAFDPDEFLKQETTTQAPVAFDVDAFLGESSSADVPTIDRGGVGSPLSREVAKSIAQQRLVARDPSRLMLINEGLPDQAVGVKGQGVVPRALAATVGGGFTGGPARIIQDLILKAGLTSPEVVDAIGVNRVAQENPGTVLGGNLVGSLVPAGRALQGTTAAGKIGLSALLGGGYGASESLKEGGLERLINDQGKIAKDATTTALISAILPSLMAGSSALSGTLKESAAKDVSQALAPTTATNKAIVERITPEILKRPMRETYALTKKGLEQKTEIQQEIAGEAIDAFGKLKGDVNPNQVVTGLEKLKKPFVVEGKVIDPDAIQQIEGIQDVFKQYGNSISKEGLREIRRTFDSQIKESKGFFKDLNQGSLLNIKKTAANEIREILAQQEPDLAKLNKQFNFWSNFNDVISQTVSRQKPQTGLTGNIAAIGFGATGVGPMDIAARAALAKGVVAAIRSPGWKLASARIKNNLAEAIADGNSTQVDDILSTINPAIRPISEEALTSQPSP